MKKILKWFGVSSGAMTSLLGVIGATLLVACPCKVAALSAIVIGIFGTGASVYIKKYSYILIAVGILLFAGGVYSLVSSRKKTCKCCEEADS